MRTIREVAEEHLSHCEQCAKQAESFVGIPGPDPVTGSFFRVECGGKILWDWARGVEAVVARYEAAEKLLGAALPGEPG